MLSFSDGVCSCVLWSLVSVTDIVVLLSERCDSVLGVICGGSGVGIGIGIISPIVCAGSGVEATESTLLSTATVTASVRHMHDTPTHTHIAAIIHTGFFLFHETIRFTLFMTSCLPLLAEVVPGTNLAFFIEDLTRACA